MAAQGADILANLSNDYLSEVHGVSANEIEIAQELVRQIIPHVRQDQEKGPRVQTKKRHSKLFSDENATQLAA